MIIKFYNNGWNYIDEAENVKWIKKKIEMAVGTDSEKRDQHVKGRIYVTISDLECLETRVRVEIEYQLSKYNKVSYGELIDEIDYSELMRLLKKGEEPYIELIVYNKSDSRKVLSFMHQGYLLNDNGQTIEKLS